MANGLQRAIYNLANAVPLAVMTALAWWLEFHTWRSGWDSNPRTVARQLISSQSRYDHFDTAPYSIYCINVRFRITLT